MAFLCNAKTHMCYAQNGLITPESDAYMPVVTEMTKRIKPRVN